MDDVIVVGAGLAGLYAARTLAAAGISARLLEARDRVGGRTLSQPLGHDVIDLGAQWVGPTQDRIRRLADELGMRTFPQYSQGRKWLDIGGRLSSYTGTIPSLPLFSLLDLQWAITRLERLARKIPFDHPDQAGGAAGWDAITVEDWKQQRVFTDSARAVLDGAVRAIFAAEPADISFLYFLHYLRSGGGLLRLAEIKNGAQQDRFVGGAQQLSQCMADMLDEPVILNAPVRAITQDDTGVIVQSDAGQFHARYAIVAIPPILAAEIVYQPALPAARQQVGERMPMGSVIKCILAYERPFWRDAGFSGEVLSDGDPVRLVFDDSPADSSQGALVGFLLGDSARRWSQHPQAERAHAVQSYLARLFGPQAAQPIAYADQDWPAETWSRGCYVGLMQPGTLTAYGQALRPPVGRIHWAGTETASRWIGYMDGALESGERAAHEIQTRLQQEQS